MQDRDRHGLSSENMGDYTLFRAMAERRNTKPERNMHKRVAITVTNVPLSGAEWGPPLQAPHCQPREKHELD